MDKKDIDITNVNMKDYINDFYNNEVYNNPNNFGLYDRPVNKTNKNSRSKESKYKFKDYSNENNIKSYRNINSNIAKKYDDELKNAHNNKGKRNKNVSISRKKAKSKNKVRKKVRINYKRIVTIMCIFTLFIFSLWYLEDSKKVRVIIDAGHGGNDVGALYNERCEKDDNLKIATLIYEKLKKEKDFKVILTRKDDTYLSLEERVNFGNKKRAKLFVSIHRNDAEVGNGVEVWIPNEASNEEKEIAKEIMEALSKTNISRNRGVKEGRVSQGRRHRSVHRQAARRLPRWSRVPRSPGCSHLRADRRSGDRG